MEIVETHGRTKHPIKHQYVAIIVPLSDTTQPQWPMAFSGTEVRLMFNMNWLQCPVSVSRATSPNNLTRDLCFWKQSNKDLGWREHEMNYKEV